ncbi:hypothetical protein [Nocardiopsis alba]|nr:hypothetical protein [Nocardiopsis alba]
MANRSCEGKAWRCRMLLDRSLSPTGVVFGAVPEWVRVPVAGCWW